MGLRSALAYLEHLRQNEDARLELLYTANLSHETIVARGGKLGYFFTLPELSKAFVVHWEMVVIAKALQPEVYLSGFEAKRA